MFRDFKQKYPEFQCSSELYRQTVKELNIAFTKLGHEECEQCAVFEKHGHTEENLIHDCETCNKYIKHKKKATSAREQYRKDAEMERCGNQIDVCYSADLQKVIMLPRMEEFKVVLFTPRIIAFNESFVPVGKKQNLKPIATLWHEGISGRRKEDITSAFYAFFLLNRDAKKITIWLDNCSSQNKNWGLFSFLIHVVNSPLIQCEEINLKYFEPGHTFNSADSFHHQVELCMKNKKICDFQDFTHTVKSANSGKVIVRELNVQDFYNWADYTSQIKVKKINPRPYLSDIVQIMATRGTRTLKYLTDFDLEEPLEMDFLKINWFKNGIPLPDSHKDARGIPTSKKQAIIKHLCPLMEESRRIFWENLKEAQVNDLNDSFE